MGGSPAIVDARSLSRTFPGNPPVRAVIDASLRVEEGERVAIIGPSGAGKSTLLSLLGLLDRPTAGSYQLRGVETTEGAKHDRLRADSIGFVFQAYHVLSHLTPLQNVELKLSTAGEPRRGRRDRALAALESVDLLHRADARSGTLSGGEKQRLAIARAVVGQPVLLLADEPTGNLDRDNADRVLSLLARQASGGTAVIVITHDSVVADWADRTLTLAAGKLFE